MGKANCADTKVKQGGQYERYYDSEWNRAAGFPNFLAQDDKIFFPLKNYLVKGMN